MAPQITKFRIIVLHNDGTQQNTVVEAPSYFDLAAEVAGKNQKFHSNNDMRLWT